ncbi:hypothetical protein [Georgenia sp. SUBG003]
MGIVAGRPQITVRFTAADDGERLVAGPGSPTSPAGGRICVVTAVPS